MLKLWEKLDAFKTSLELSKGKPEFTVSVKHTFPTTNPGARDCSSPAPSHAPHPHFPPSFYLSLFSFSFHIFLTWHAVL